MRNIKVDVNKLKGRVFAYLKESCSERTVRKYILREKAIPLGALISQTDSLMVFSILGKNDEEKPSVKKKTATVAKQPEKKTQTTRRRRRKQSVKKDTTTSQ